MDEFREVLAQIENANDEVIKFFMLAKLVFIWPPNDEQYARAFLEEIPEDFLSSVLDPSFGERLRDRLPDGKGAEIAPEEIILSILRALTLHESLRTCEKLLGLCPQVTELLTNKNEALIPDLLSYYYNVSCASGHSLCKCLSEDMLVGISSAALGAHADFARGTLGKILCCLREPASRDVYDTKRILHILERCMLIFLGHFEEDVSRMDILMQILDIFLVVDDIYARDCDIVKNFAVRYITRFRNNVKFILTAKGEKIPHVNILASASCSVLGIFNLIGKWAGKDWLMTKGSISAHKISDTQLVTIVISLASLELRELVDDTPSRSLEKLKSSERRVLLVFSIDVLRSAAEYFSEISDTASTEFWTPELLMHCMELLRSIFTQAVDFIVEISKAYDDYQTKLDDSLLLSLISCCCFWCSETIGSSGKSINSLINIALDLCKTELKNSAWTSLELFSTLLFSMSTEAKNYADLIGHGLWELLVTYWINSPLNNHTDFYICSALRNFALAFPNCPARLMRAYHLKFLDRLEQLCETNPSSEKIGADLNPYTSLSVLFLALNPFLIKDEKYFEALVLETLKNKDCNKDATAAILKAVDSACKVKKLSISESLLGNLEQQAARDGCPLVKINQ